MSKKKAALITIVLAVMTVIILICLLLLNAKIVFYIATGAFAVLGLIATGSSVYAWLSGQEDETLPPVVLGEEAES